MSLPGNPGSDWTEQDARDVEHAMRFVEEFFGDKRCSLNAKYATALRREILRLRAELDATPRWWEAAGFFGPFTPAGEGGNDGYVRDVQGAVVADCHGWEARADVIAELLNRRSRGPSGTVKP